jgi:hypothetical protein
VTANEIHSKPYRLRSLHPTEHNKALVFSYDEATQMAFIKPVTSLSCNGQAKASKVASEIDSFAVDLS